MKRPAFAGTLAGEIARAAGVGIAASTALSLAILVGTFGLDLVRGSFAAAAFDILRFGVFCG